MKLENILIDANINLKIIDFGLSTYRQNNLLQSYKGTVGYMPPEIVEGKQYSGQKCDIFSAGVILFIIVTGLLPFKQAHKHDYHYKSLSTKCYEKYWNKIDANSELNLSNEFKDLM